MIILWETHILAQKPDGIIYFAAGKANLNTESKILLNNLMDNTKKSPSATITIRGFADENGNKDLNLTLSEKRALAVSDYFTTNGIEKKVITIQFFGEDKPTAKDGKNQRENRRVEITISTAKKTDKKSTFGIYAKLWKAPAKQIFSATKVAANEDLVVDGAGTKIWIPANSLCRPNGEPARGDVEIELTEYYKRSEMVLANLIATSDSTMLETDCIINVVVRSGGERLSLKKGSEMGIQFMVNKEKQGMGIFIASQPGNQMNWEQQLDNGIVAREMPTSFVGSSQGVKRSSVDNLVLSSRRLGWISCSRFSKIEVKTNLSVEVDPMYHAIVRLVLKDLHAIIAGYSNGKGTYRVINIPIGQKATLVIFGMVKETPYFISKDIVISDNQVEKLVPRITTFETLKTILRVN